MARIFGGWGNDVLYGTDGWDYITGHFNHDRLYGWEGNDRLSGGEGNDHLIGGTGADVLTGGSGRDTFYFSWETDWRNRPIGIDGGLGGNADIITDFRRGPDKINLEGYENPYMLGAKWIGLQAPNLADPMLQVGFRWEGDTTVVEVYAKAQPEITPANYTPYPTIEIILYGHHNLTANDFWL